MHLRQSSRKTLIGFGTVLAILLFFGSSHYLQPTWSVTHVSGYITLLFSAIPLVLVARKEWVVNAYFVAFILFVLISGFSGTLSRQTQGFM